MELNLKYKTLLDGYQINTPLRLAHFMSQIDHESGLKSVRESCYYKTISGLKSTFYTPFKGKTNSFIAGYLKNTEKCANYVYANRGGNGDEKSGDGYKFRGGGMLQNTFRDGYLKLTKDTGIDFLSNPDLILDEANAMVAACNYWKSVRLNKFADADDLDAVSDLINKGRLTSAVGDTNGFEDRKKKLSKWKKILQEQK
jgi:putative chitinase